MPIVSIAKREEELLVHKIGSQIDTAFIKQIQSQPRTGIAIHEDGDVYVVNLHPSQRNAGSHSKNLRASTEQNRKERPTTDESGLATTDIIKLFQRIRDESHRFEASAANEKPAGRNSWCGAKNPRQIAEKIWQHQPYTERLAD